MSLDGMEGLTFVPARDRPGRFPRLSGARVVYPGFFAALVIGAAAAWIEQRYSVPIMLITLLLGMGCHFLYGDRRCTAGIEFSSKIVLRIGVALLGARVTLAEISDLVALPIVIVLCAIPSTMLLGRFAARALREPTQLGMLTGGAVGICGASAALAIAATLPRTADNERDTIFTVISVTALSTLAMILYPALIGLLHLDHRSAGIFLGASIHDVAQVVGAGYTVSPLTGDIATYVKLLRVAMLIPVVTALTLAGQAGQSPSGVGKRLPIPLFLLAFVALSVARNAGLFSKFDIDLMSGASQACLVTVIAALGMKTAFKNLLALGWRPVALVIAETLWIAALSLSAVMIFY